jgi:hypothetical protein
MRTHHDKHRRIAETATVRDGVPLLRTTHNGTLVAVHADRFEPRGQLIFLSERRTPRRRRRQPGVADVLSALADDAA